MATKTKAKAKVFAGLEAPRTECPFHGEPLVFAEVTTLAAGHKMPMIQVRGTGWVSTKLFNSRAEAEYFFSYERGVPPAFPNPVPRVSVRTIERPDPAQAEVEASLKAAGRFGEQAVEILEK